MEIEVNLSSSQTVETGLNSIQSIETFVGGKGPRGPQGVQGAQGVQGTGPQGAQGIEGAQGVQGIQGAQGFQGPQGSQGFQGPQGVQGAQGVQGFQGPQGAQGFLGSTGPQGNQGIQGSQGSQGPTATVPDQSVILDDISSQFNGSLTQFTISTGAVNFINSEIDSAARLLISVGGVVQQPDPSQNYGFYISGGSNRTIDPVKINFVEAPRRGMAFFGVAIKSTNSPTTPFAKAGEPITYAIVFGV